MSDLTITQVKNAKRDLEQHIAKLLEEFVDKTGVKIDDVELSDAQLAISGEIVRYFVTVELKL